MMEPPVFVTDGDTSRIAPEVCGDDSSADELMRVVEGYRALDDLEENRRILNTDLATYMRGV